MLPVQLEHAAIPAEKNAAVPRAEPVETVFLNVDRHQRGAAAASEALVHAVTDGVYRLIIPLRHGLPRQSFLVQLQKALRRPLAGGLSVQHTAHAVGHQGKQAALRRIGGSQDGKGILLALPRPNPLEIRRLKDWGIFRGLSGRLRGLGCGAAEQIVKQPHPSPPFSR